MKSERAAGNREMAAEIGRLRRPTQSAWAINQWVRSDRDGVEELLGLGAALVAAQRRGAVDALRELSGRRQEAVTRAAAAVVALAAGRGVRLSESAGREVVSSLRAAIADEGVAEVIRRGRLVAAAEYSGFGPAGVFVVPDLTETADTEVGEVGAETADESDVDLRTGADAEVSAADAAQDAAHRRLNDAAAALEDASATVAALDDRLTGLRAELSRLEGEMRFARRALNAAQEEHQEAKADHRDCVLRSAEAHRVRAEFDR
ncbi:hypothetical protein QSJ18_18910 [Gordonia sp. ABSL1-1]|uniref:hypothetical protein n=1 Tax=Gordonia sp. ABSL1-1 TaxID=3053923 RepID=UPI00257449EC|nr:hypothetical protein [Gordonia sp. ABSL1-1]MDL9938821.1 hypothetical protein [Gordonia sp. ABSL1-1]